ncbi:MAG: hypothetical protein CL455_06600 [Acidimicrobiaceae bacterium]|nr:hypothetical protein [Acidimicrobiaceae bacterium]MED5230651.1 hypothetical protein [Actinomycetota bacterium]
MTASYNPDYDPDGIEGGIDTNVMPWIEIKQAPGMRFKPLRASQESGWFSLIVQIEAGVELPPMVYLGGGDMMLLSGLLSYTKGDLAATIGPGIWGYIPANSRIEGLVVTETTEFQANFFGSLAFLAEDGRSVESILTSLDVLSAARTNGLTLVPNSLAECMQPRPAPYHGEPEPLAIAGDENTLVNSAEGLEDEEKFTHPHWVDTRTIPWIYTIEGMEDMGLKILRVSEETGIVSLLVLHNGVAGPHYHLGAADFLILSGHLGFRAGPTEGYGPGVWFYEPAGARHDATQRVGENEDLIYTANVYGPVQFDEGRDTPITMVLSWMSYKAMADASGAQLVRNVFPNDSSLLAWSPIGNNA